MSDSNDTTMNIIEICIKIARFLVDLLLAVANGKEITLPDFGGLDFLPTKPDK